MADDLTPDTVFVRGTGGAIFEMDVPTRGMALERWNEQLAKGDLTLVETAHWVERGDGSKYLVAGPADGSAQTAKKSAGKKSKDVPTADPDPASGADPASVDPEL